MAYGRTMRSKRLRHRIQLQRREPVTTDFEPSASWATYADVWAEKRDPRGSEVVAGIQADAVMTVVFRMHYRADVRPTDRVLFGSRQFDIAAATNPDGREGWLFLHCTEHHSDGE